LFEYLKETGKNGISSSALAKKAGAEEALVGMESHPLKKPVLMKS
jgi:hypothetical protein